MKPEKNQKKKAGNFHKYTEIKQHAPKQPIIYIYICRQITCQNVWDAEAVQRGKFTMINAYLRKTKDLKQTNFASQRTR